MTRNGEPHTAPTDAATAATAEDGALMREMRLQRNLKILIAVMTLIIVAGLGAIIARIMIGGGKSATQTTTLARPGAPGSSAITLELPPGAKIVSVSVSGNRLAVHHESTAGAGIAILDLDTGARIADVKAQAALPNTP